MAVHPNPDDLRPRRLRELPIDLDVIEDDYWQCEGQVIFRGEPVRHADPSTFVFFTNGYAKDERGCYCVGRRMLQVDPAQLRPLNFTFVTDGTRVWCLGGAVKGAHAQSFVVLDDGRYELDGGRVVVPHSYARDDEQVFFYNYDGKANVVRGADAKSFLSLGDGVFALDDRAVFVDGKRCNAMNRKAWRKLGGKYSADGLHAYYFASVVEGADLATFRVVKSRSGIGEWAMDKHRRYRHGSVFEPVPYWQEFWERDAAHFEATE